MTENEREYFAAEGVFALCPEERPLPQEAIAVLLRSESARHSYGFDRRLVWDIPLSMSPGAIAAAAPVLDSERGGEYTRAAGK
jgi:hypothetical protein